MLPSLVTCLRDRVAFIRAKYIDRVFMEDIDSTLVQKVRERECVCVSVCTCLCASACACMMSWKKPTAGKRELICHAGKS